MTIAPEQQTVTRRAKGRVPLVEDKGLFSRLMGWYSRRTYDGEVLDTGLAMMHNRRVLWSTLRFEAGVSKWNSLSPDLKILAELATASRIGCSWCMDFGWYAAHSEGLDTSRLGEVAGWRESDVFTDLERRVLAYAEAMTATPPEVTDEMTEALRADLGDDGLVELTMIVAVENERSRSNSAIGLSSQGFRDRCSISR